MPIPRLQRSAFLRSTPLTKAADSYIIGGTTRSDSSGESFTSLMVPDPLPSTELAQLQKIFDVTLTRHGGIGTHPQFQDLQLEQGVKHHCTSVFVDIVNSTHLGVMLPTEDAFFLKNAVIRLAIEAMRTFGGHVHRLQGDGLFAQFVDRGGDPRRTALAALDAAAVLLYYVERQLNPDIIEPSGLEPVRLRIGIDYGNDDEVIWARYGDWSCEEFTTTGLHVDLAAKLQSRTLPNSVALGDNVKGLLSLEDAAVEPPLRTRNGERSRDEIRMQPAGEDYRYQYWLLDWRNWTRHLDWLEEENACKIVASVGDHENGPFYLPLQPGGRVAKGRWIQMSVVTPNHVERHKWEVVNQGVEAVAAGHKAHSDTATTLVRAASFEGLHFAFYRGRSANGKLVAAAAFPVRIS